MTTWVDRAEQRLASARETQGLNIHDFEWVHLGHGIGTLRYYSEPTDGSTTDESLLTVSAIQEVCPRCKDTEGNQVKSAVESPSIH